MGNMEYAIFLAMIRPKRLRLINFLFVVLSLLYFLFVFGVFVSKDHYDYCKAHAGNLLYCTKNYLFGYIFGEYAIAWVLLLLLPLPIIYLFNKKLKQKYFVVTLVFYSPLLICLIVGWIIYFGYSGLLYILGPLYLTGFK